MAAFLSGLGSIAGKVGSTLNNPAVRSTLGKVGNFANSMSENPGLGGNPPAPQAGQTPQNGGLSNVRPVPPPQTGTVGDIFRGIANRRAAAATNTNIGKSPDVAGFGIGAGPAPARGSL